MAKKKIKEEIDHYIYWDNISLEDLKANIAELENIGITHVSIETRDKFGYETLTVTPLKERLETDEEYKKRKEIEKMKFETQRQKELRQLKELKAKYE